MERETLIETVGGEVLGTDRVLEGSRPKEGKEG